VRKKREELTGREKAVCDTLDEVLFRSHGITTSAHDEDLFLDLLLAEGYVVIPDRRKINRRTRNRRS
jgi:hypothetical protein